jgi:GNAT superfamily N-acetyltransferase
VEGFEGPAIRSLAWATDIDVLPLDRQVQRRESYWRVRSPSNPGHWWGNFLLFDRPPGRGDREAWESAFAREFEADEVRHRTFAWDAPDGDLGQAESEFVPGGYRLEHTVALTARPSDLISHPRENREVIVRQLDPAGGADHQLWAQVVELQVAVRDPWIDEASHRQFVQARQADLRRLFRAGRGGWFVALTGDGRAGEASQVVGSCGLVVTGPRGRYQAVDTAEPHRRRGICSRLVVEAARLSQTAHRIEHLVICADPGYHALGIYESLGFSRAERVAGVLRQPDAA